MTYINPVYSEYLADPFVWRAGDSYYAIGTGPSDGGMRFPLLQSPNLVDWELRGCALRSLAPEFGDAYWAPEVAFSDGAFYLYYSVGHGHKGHQLRVAISASPLGPYEDVGAPVGDPSSCPFAIDGHPFQDTDGQWYLFYARDFLDCEDGVRPGTAIAVDRLVDMVRLAGEERVVARARHDWQRFVADRPMYGGVYDWHTLEGPAVLKHDGRYYCFYSGGCFENDTYGVDYVVSGSVLGPYTDSSTDAGARVLRTVPNHVIGPGHNSFVGGPNGSTYVVYHAWDPDMTARRMCIDKLRWDADGPIAVVPSFAEQEL